MNRRNFLGTFGAMAALSALAPSTLSAVNYRNTTPKAFSATKVDAAMKALFGTTATTNSGVKVKAPNIAENGAVIPVSFETKKLNVKRIAVFQDANPEATVMVVDIPPRAIVDYSIRIKMQKTGNVTVVAETTDGKLHSAVAEVKVTIGGCGG